MAIAGAMKEIAASGQDTRKHASLTNEGSGSADAPDPRHWPTRSARYASSMKWKLELDRAGISGEQARMLSAIVEGDVQLTRLALPDADVLRERAMLED